MTHSHLRRISPAKAAIRPSMTQDARGDGEGDQKFADWGVGEVLQRRARYCIRFARYLAIHRNIENVRWVLACEGTTWN